MRVWLVHVGEPLPIDSGNERQLRMSLFAQMLADRGHDVTWWSSTFDHNHKRQRFSTDTAVTLRTGLELRLLHARPYASNISLDRLANHYQLARAFERAARGIDSSAAPAVIFATMPTVELAAAAARYGKAHGVPVVIDVRDLHPDIYLQLVPAVAKPLARLALTPLYRELRTALRLADGLVSIAPSFQEWALRHAGRGASSSDAIYPLAYPALEVPSSAINAAGEAMRSAGVDPQRKVIWYVGTFNRWIDLGTPIRAARLLHEQGLRDFQFVLSGSGDFEPEWRRLAGDLPNVVFTGWIDVAKIAWMRSIAWAGLAPYRPGFLTVGNKLFEYMAGALPILLSIGGDARTVVERHDCGIAYDGGDPQSLAACIQSLDGPGVQTRMAANSLAAYREGYEANKVYGEMAEFVLGFAKQKQSASA